MNTGDEKYQRHKTFNQKVPFYDLKGLVDESEIKNSGGLFEEDSFLDEQPLKQKSFVDQILGDKKSKYDLEKEAE
jgi:hypothetical protein